MSELNIDSNNSVYIYDGPKKNNSSYDKIYSKTICKNIVDNMKHINFYRTSENERIEYNKMPELYKQYRLVLRLTINDGGSETTKECKSLGIPIIHNNSKYGIKWNNINDLTHNIDNIIKNNKLRINKDIDNEIFLCLNNSITKNITKNILDATVILKDSFNIYTLTNDSSLYNNFKYNYNNIKYSNNLDDFRNCIEYSDNTNDTVSIKNKLLCSVLEKRKYIPKMFSIIITYYKKEKYIKDAIESILKQLYRNFEIIIINDDPDYLELDNYVCDFMNNTNIKCTYIRNYKNVGTYNCRNIGIMNSNGEYISILDADDIYTKTKLSDEVNILSEEECFAVRSKYIRKNCNTNEVVEQFINYQNGMYGDNMITFKKKVFVDNGLYDNTRFAGDSEFYTRIKNTCKVVSLNKCNYIAYMDTIEKNNLTTIYNSSERQQYIRNIKTDDYIYINNFIKFTNF